MPAHLIAFLRWLPRLSAAAALVVLGSGCVSSIVAEKIITAPNKSGMKGIGADSGPVQYAPVAFAETWTVPAGPPPASIAVGTVEPGDYQLRYDLEFTDEPGKPKQLKGGQVFWAKSADRVPATAPSKGTVLLLHGYLQSKEFMVPWAVLLAQAGYRCVLIDHRGQGASTGEYISFGAFEARDVSTVLDDLGRRGWDVSRVGVLGVSYGSSVGLLAAGRDPRIATVVALEPFSSAKVVVPELMRAVFTKQAAGISDRQFAAAHRKQPRIAGFDWADADVPAALEQSDARVLFIHGAEDTWVAAKHSEILFPHAKPGSRLVLVPRENHFTLPLQIGILRDDVLAWFEAEMAAPRAL